MTMVVCY